MTVSETVISDAKIRIISESTKEMGRKTARGDNHRVVSPLKDRCISYSEVRSPIRRYTQIKAILLDAQILLLATVYPYHLQIKLMPSRTTLS